MTRLLVLVIAMLLPTSVFAKSNCSGDIEKFCADKEKSQIAACLDEHQSELSAACQAAREASKACVDDVKKFCPDAAKPKDRNACMDQHKDELSPACKTAREKLQ
jgi:hypothetical protein